MQVAFFHPEEGGDMDANMVANTIVKTLTENNIEVKYLLKLN